MDPRLREVLDDPVAALYGTSAAADALVAECALDCVADVLRNGWRSKAHPIDVIEALQHLLGRMALGHYEDVKLLLDDSSLRGNLGVVTGALAWSRTALSRSSGRT